MNGVACLASVSLVAFLGVVALAEALHGVGTAWGRDGMGRDGDPWHGMVGDAHPPDCVEAMALSRTAREMAAGEWFRTTVSCCSHTRSAD